MKVVGIDGCNGGWCVVSNEKDQLKLEVISSFHKVIQNHSMASIILVDIPIGLGSRDVTRDVDHFARKLLDAKRQSSLFIPPNREAIAASDYASAKEINKEITGKKISIQSWNISHKIREVDQFILNNPELNKQIREAHPEICFKFLNDGIDLNYSKNASGRKGIKERISILSRYESTTSDFVNRAYRQHPARLVRIDDILDAFCLAITANLGLLHGFQQITGSQTQDASGIEMSLYYFDPKIE